MSIDGVMRNALSGLNTSQAALRTTADNIANVNTPGYARKVVHLEGQVVGSQPAGVKISSIERVVDEFVRREYRSALSQVQTYHAANQIYDQLDVLFGDPNDNTSIPGRLDTLFNSLADLSLEPDSLIRRLGALTEMQNFTTEISRLSDQIQLLRREADQQIVTDIQVVNDAILRVHDLNARIISNSTMGRDVSTLEDQRTQAILEIAEVIDIRTFQTSHGGMGISTTGGVVLLDDVTRALTYTARGTFAPNTQVPQITANKINPVTGVVESFGKNIDTAVTDGRLRGWLDMRDQGLPNLAAELGELAGQLADQINAIHNDGSAVPPPSSLSGRATGLLSTDSHGFTGQVTFAVTDTNNALAVRVEVDFTAGTYSVNGGAASSLSGTTIGSLITDLNANLGAGRSLTLSSTGALTFASSNTGEGVVIQQGATPSSRGGRGFSHFFGMNDLMQATAEAHYDTGLATGSAHGFGSSGVVNMVLRGPNNTDALSFSLDFSAVGGGTMNDVVTYLNTQTSGYGTWALDSNGALGFTPVASFTGYDVWVSADTTDRSSTGVTFARMFGIGPEYGANRARGMQVVSTIQADPSRMALADLDTTVAAPDPALTMGDGRGAVALQQLAQQTVNFSAAGGLAGVSTWLGDYANTIMSTVSVQAAHSETLETDRTAMSDELKARSDSVSGVNLDEELANMVIYQNTYNAAARVISTANEMFETLLSL